MSRQARIPARVRRLIRQFAHLGRALGLRRRRWLVLLEQITPPPPPPLLAPPVCGRCGDDLPDDVMTGLRCEACAVVEKLLQDAERGQQQAAERRAAMKSICRKCGGKLSPRRVRLGLRLCERCQDANAGVPTGWEGV